MMAGEPRRPKEPTMPAANAWRLRSCVSLIAALASAVLMAGPAQAKPAVIMTGASVVGGGTAGNGSFDISAQAQPDSSSAGGFANFDLAIGCRWSGQLRAGQRRPRRDQRDAWTGNDSCRPYLDPRVLSLHRRR